MQKYFTVVPLHLFQMGKASPRLNWNPVFGISTCPLHAPPPITPGLEVNWEAHATRLSPPLLPLKRDAAPQSIRL